MARVEKRYDEKGKLSWARGRARDIYKDLAICDSKGGILRIPGEPRPYRVMLPRHCAGSIIGERFDLNAELPPFKEWRFVLLGYGEGAEGDFEVSREISGDAIVEVDGLNPAEEAA